MTRQRQPTLAAEAARAFASAMFRESVVATLTEYIRIPNKSPAFDAKWREHGYMDRAVALFSDWARSNGPARTGVEVIRLPGRTPLIFVEIPGTSPGTVLLYGHLDKQPEMVGWSEGLGPWTPSLRGDRLYGRGGADDGYALFAALTAVAILHDQDVPHSRCVILIEACEESGSYDLPPYIDYLSDRIGVPDLVICLDSGCGNYDQLWCTTSLRGMITATLAVELVREGVHSGDASGIIASSFRVARHLLSRLEDEATGQIRPSRFYAEIPAARRREAQAAAQVLDRSVYSKFPLHEGVHPVTEDLGELVLNRTWRPALSITGAEGLPHPADAGNVLRPRTALKLSLRLPPTVDAARASQELRALLTADPPYGARVSLTESDCASGWNAPEVAPWLAESLEAASQTYFGRRAMFMGEGGSIPFMGMLGAKFPAAQFFITGVLGPHSNAHGPNEFLHLPTAERISLCVARVLCDYARQSARA